MQNFELQREAIQNGIFGLPVAEGVSLELVNAGDIGTFAATALANPAEYVGETIELVGGEHTLESAAEVFTDVTGKDVEAHHVPVETARQNMPEPLVLGFEWRNEHFEETSEDRDRDIGIELTRLDTYLRDHRWDQQSV